MLFWTEKVWKILRIDFIGPLDKTKRANSYIMTSTDLFSKWPIVYPLPSKEASGVALMIIKVFCTYGFPNAVLTDNGTEFVSKVGINLSSYINKHSFYLKISTDKNNILISCPPGTPGQTLAAPDMNRVAHGEQKL